MLRFLSATLLVLAGCGDLDLSFSTDATSVTAISYGDSQTTVSVCGGPSGLLDCNEDNLSYEITMGGVAVEPTEGFLSFGELTASFSTNAADTAIEVAELPSGGVADGSMPAPFELFGPVPSGDGTEFHLAWTPSTDTLSWSASTSCSDSTSNSSDGNPTQAVTIDDTGVLTLHTSDLPAVNGSSDCTGTITLTRERDGSAGGFADGSTMKSQQVRGVTFDLSYM